MMRAPNRASSRNALIRKVQRHAAVATLFRRPASRTTLPAQAGQLAPARLAELSTASELPDSAAAPGAGTAVQMSSAPARARAATIQGSISTRQSGPQQGSPAQSAGRAAVDSPTPSQPQPGLPAATPAGAGGLAPASAPARMLYPNPSAAREVQGQPPVPSASAEQTAAGLDEPTWKRLERIFKGHQQKQAEEVESSPAAQETPVASELAAPSPSAKSVQRQPQLRPVITEIDPKPAAAVFRKTDEREPAHRPAESAALEELPPSPASQAEPAPGSMVERKSAGPGAPPVDSLSLSPSPGQAASYNEVSGAAPVEAARSFTQPPGPDADRQGATGAAQAGEWTAEQSEFEETGEPGIPAQPVPLHDAWPIQRVDNPGQDTLIDVQPPAGLPAGTAEENRFQGVSTGPSISRTVPGEAHHLLENISPGQPTDSRVEYIPPRGSRPAAGSPPSQPAPLPIQRSAEPAEGGGEPASQYPVETDIGPLPSDLWQLIGQSPPANGLASPGTAGEAKPNAGMLDEPSIPAPALPGEHASAPAPSSPGEHPRSPAAVQRQAEVTRSSPQALSMVQRQAEPGAEGEMAEPAGDQAGPPDAGKEGGEEMDVDELARRVYGEIHRRLALEWERLRRRL